MSIYILLAVCIFLFFNNNQSNMSKRLHYSQYDRSNNIVIIPSNSLDGELPNKKRKTYTLPEPKNIQQSNNIAINTNNMPEVSSSGNVKTCVTKDFIKNKELLHNNESLDNHLVKNQLDCSNNTESELQAVNTIQIYKNSGQIQYEKLSKTQNVELIKIKSGINESTNIKNSGDIVYEKPSNKQNIDLIKNIGELESVSNVSQKVTNITITEKIHNIVEQLSMSNDSTIKLDKQLSLQENINLETVDKSDNFKKHVKNKNVSCQKKIVMKIELYINSINEKPHITIDSSSDTDNCSVTTNSDEILQNSYSKFFDDFDVDEIVNSLVDSNTNKNEIHTKTEQSIRNYKITDSNKSKPKDDVHSFCKERIELFNENETKSTEIKKEENNENLNADVIVIEDSDSEQESAINEIKSIIPIKSKIIQDKINIKKTKNEQSSSDIEHSNSKENSKRMSSENIVKTQNNFRKSNRNDSLEIQESARCKSKVRTGFLDVIEQNKQNDHKYNPVKSVIKKPVIKDECNITFKKEKKVYDEYNYPQSTLLIEADDQKRRTTIKFEDDPTIYRKPRYVSNNLLNNSQAFTEAKHIFSPEEELFAIELETRLHYILKQNYSVMALIQDGKYSKIYKCKNSKGEEYALKCLHPARELFKVGIKSESMLKDLQRNYTPGEHYNCVFVVEGFSLSGSWCYLMEYYPINLAQALQKNETPFHIDSVQNLAWQLASAVEILQRNKIIHSDIKPTHILLNRTQDRLKLCGFDTAYYIYNVRVHRNIGTVCYRPPEIILGCSAGYTIDVWTTALVMYEMTTNHKLFKSYFNNNVLYKQICTLGRIPTNMIETSLYKESHFDGNIFMQKFARGDPVPVYSFPKVNTIDRMLLSSYNKYWPHRTKVDQLQDLEKLTLLNKLLYKMLVINPKNRMPIRYVKEHSFFSNSSVSNR